MSNVEVHVEINSSTIHAGTLYSFVRRTREGTTFHYDLNYLSNTTSYSFEPAMPLAAGEFSVPHGLPLSFRDASPDRWGRMLIDKGLKLTRSKNHEPTRTTTEIDYLLGTSDITRQGALRFKEEGGEEFEASHTKVPKLISLPQLLMASNQLCNEAQGASTNEYAAVKLLLDAGTGSLGGARPKSSVIDRTQDGSTVLYLAKFPHPADEWDVMRWEKITLDLAAASNITTPLNRLVQVDGSNILLLKRFDRNSLGARIGYMSAMTLLESEEGQARDYLDIADSLSQISESASQDLRELWLRILFSFCINNTDDHLRNHGLLRSKQAWKLSPVFDINPNPDLNSQHATSINGETSSEQGLQALQESQEFFGISASDASDLKSTVKKAFSKWQTIARAHGATKEEMTLFAPLFENAQQMLN